MIIKKVIFSGTPWQDIAFDLKKNRETTIAKLRLNENIVTNNKPILLVSIIPDYFKDYNKEFSDFKTFLDFMFNVLDFETYNIIFQLHPACDNNIKQIIINKGGLLAKKMSVIELLSISELYITSVSSSIRYATMLAIPTINFDYYNFYYKDYFEFESVCHVYNKEDFKSVINNKPLLQELKRKAELDALKYGPIDGKSCERIFNKIEENENNNNC